MLAGALLVFTVAFGAAAQAPSASAPPQASVSAPSAPGSASALASASPAPPASSGALSTDTPAEADLIEPLRALAKGVRALIAGKPTEHDLEALLGRAAASEAEWVLERRRLERVLAPVHAKRAFEKRLVELQKTQAEELVAAQKKSRFAVIRLKRKHTKALEQLRSERPAVTGTEPPDGVSKALWEARLELDEARLAFLELEPDQRAERIKTHSEHMAAAKAKRERALKAVDTKAKSAKAKRDRALEIVNSTDDETEKAIQSELGRLLDIQIKQAQAQGEELKLKQAADASAAAAQRLQSDTVDLIERLRKSEATAVEADARFDELTRKLTTAFDESYNATRALSASADVPGPGSDRLGDIGDAEQREQIDKLRTELAKEQGALARTDEARRRNQAHRLRQRIDSLNRTRLGLYPYLSSAKLSKLTGVDRPALEEAGIEFKSLVLQVSYDVAAMTSWGRRLVKGGVDPYSEFVRNSGIVKVLLLLLVVVWWRRRGAPIVERLAAQEQAGRATLLARAMIAYRPARGPLEWLAFGYFAMTLLPAHIAGSLEMQAVWLAARWILGGLAAVYLIDGWARRRRAASAESQLATLRLRTLKLLGWVSIAVGLSQALTGYLFGAGTVHLWVESVSWIVLIPVGFIIVSWWRSIVFERLAQRAGGNSVARWVTAKRGTLMSFPAAAVGGSYLLATGALRLVKGYLGDFDLSRRIVAYFFRREISRQSKQRAGEDDLRPLSTELFEKLDPRRKSAMVTTPAGWDLGQIIGRYDAGETGLVALVGERGIGKTTLLSEMAEARSGTALNIQCPREGFDELRSALRKRFDLPEDANDLAIARAIEKSEITLVFLDDVHRVVEPAVGGFAEFDALLALARASSRGASWVFGIDVTIWHLIDRARFARPVFDEIVVISPWTQESITQLLRSRCEDAGIEPSFERLLPIGIVDEVEHEEALDRTQRGFYTLLWDYASGNPAVALHFWRESLGIDSDGGVCVQLFSAPETADLERLPDPAVFVLRALVQMQPALMSELVRGTRLPPRQVKDAIRYARTRGYVERQDQRISLKWHWYRAVTRFLQRRHLLPGESR